MNKNNKIPSTLGKIAQLRKRNVVSMFGNLNFRNLIFAILPFLFLAGATKPSFSASSIVQEENTRFQSETVKFPAAKTFIVAPWIAKRKPASSGIESGTKNCQIPAAYFQLGGTRLSPSEKKFVLAGVQRCGVLQTKPLHITGYTCSLGNRQENQILSLHRAKELANVLRAHGYTVKDEDIKGRGEEIPLTTDKQNFAINRRVEITE